MTYSYEFIETLPMEPVYTLELFLGREQVAVLMDYMAKSATANCHDFLCGAINNALACRDVGPLNPQHLMGSDEPLMVTTPAEGELERVRKITLIFSGDNIGKMALLGDGHYNHFTLKKLTQVMDDYIDFLKRRPGASHDIVLPDEKPKMN